MKRTLLVLAAATLIASCAAPKYSYNFGSYDYHAGKKTKATDEAVVLADGPQAVQPEQLTASTEKTVQPLFVESTAPSAPVKKTYAQMTKSERKEVRSYLKAEAKNSIKAKKAGVESVNATQKMDQDLMLASVFGAVGIVGLIIGGNVFYIIGGIALLIGVVFFVKWIVRQ